MIFEKILRAGEGRIIRRLKAIAETVNSIEDEYTDLTDAELRELTDQFKERYADGQSLDDLLPEAFAVAREGAQRVLGQRHYDVQLMGGAALHLGNIAEMKTGEGKTLTCVLPAYLNALAGKGVHVVTVNDYLAARDAEWRGRVHSFLGRSVGTITPNAQPGEHKAAYECDITYGTNNEFGFDYLRDNMAWSKEELVQRGHFFAIVDEVDSILIDEARTPLIISGPAEHSARWYTEFARIVPRLRRDRDYEVDEGKRTIGITEDGVEKVEDQLGIDNLYEAVNTPLIGYLNNALKAQELFKKDKDYIVVDGEVLIVDEFTGRVLHGRRYSEGMHQAIEAKESVNIKDENQTLATITLQNFFRLYDKLGGMTGTAMTEAGEFQKTYNVGVVPIPTHQPMIRFDRPDVVYKTELAKFEAVVEDIAERNERGQPILVGTTSVEKSEVLSTMLGRRGIQHEVLNAKNHAREAEIIAQAGREGAVTVATNMAGRGTDIMLGGNPEYLAAAELRRSGHTPEDDPDAWAEMLAPAVDAAKGDVAEEAERVTDAGGLYVLGTERHESRRIDNQLRGRSGRQGDPGESRFYLSLGDDLMRRFNSTAVEAIMDRLNIPDDVPIESKMVSRQIQSAQTQIEQQNAEARKNVLKYDEVLNKQRQVIYAERKQVLDGVDLQDQIRPMIDDIVEAYVAGATADGFAEDWDLEPLITGLGQLYPISFTVESLEEEAGGREAIDAEFLTAKLSTDAQEAYDRREKELGADLLREAERRVVLSVLDQKWREHLYEMDYLQEGIGLRAYAQRDPLVEYQREGFDLFSGMMEGIKEDSVRLLFHADIQVEEETTPGTPDVAAAAAEAGLEDATGHRHVEVRGLAGPRITPVPLQYSAPTIDGEAGAGAVAVATASSSPFGAAGDEPADGGQRRASGQKVGPGPSRNSPCPCGSGKKYKRCHGAPGGPA